MATLPRPEFPAFKPFSPEQVIDPYPVFARARKEQPVFFAPELDCYIVTRYEDVNLINGDPITFSNSSLLSPRAERPADVVRDFGYRELPLKHQLVMSDPPVHTRLKKLMMPAFLPRKVAAREAYARTYTNQLIDLIESAGSADMVNHYAQKIPPAVIGNIVGVPEGDAQQFKHWVDDMFIITGEWDVPADKLSAAWRGVFAFEDYIQALINERRRKPQDDLTSDFILATTDDGSPALSDIELLHNVVNVAAAGADTTGALIAQMIHSLLTHPDQLALVRRDRSLVPKAVEETLRYRGPIRGLMRRTMAEVELCGVPIPKDAFVFISHASANRDEAVFANPDIFDVQRPGGSRQIGFGSRVHSCLGANLARMEARVALETLLDRLPNLQLIDPDKPAPYSTNLMLPIIKELPCKW